MDHACGVASGAGLRTVFPYDENSVSAGSIYGERVYGSKYCPACVAAGTILRQDSFSFLSCSHGVSFHRYNRAIRLSDGFSELKIVREGDSKNISDEIINLSGCRMR